MTIAAYEVTVGQNSVPVLVAKFQALDDDHARRIARVLADAISASDVKGGCWTHAGITSGNGTYVRGITPNEGA